MRLFNLKNLPFSLNISSGADNQLRVLSFKKIRACSLPGTYAWICDIGKSLFPVSNGVPRN